MALDTHQYPSMCSVNRARPCVACGATKRCLIAADGSAVLCYREPAGCTKTIEDRNGEPMYLHHRDPISAAPRTRIGKPTPAAPLAPVDDRHTVYRAALAALELADIDYATLRNRGLSDDDITAGEYRTLPAAGRDAIADAVKRACPTIDLRTVPGFGADGARLTGPAGLIIPVRDRANRVVALKVRPAADDGQGKYRYLTSTTAGGPGPGAPIHWATRADDPSEPLPRARVTEGELKADAAAALSGVPTVSVPGVSNWRPVLPELTAAGCRTVVLAFDADAWTNPHVARPLAELFQQLVRDSFTVELERWDGTVAKGVDDALVAGVPIETLTGDAAGRAVADAGAMTGIAPAAMTASPPTIRIDTDEYRVNAAAAAALAAEPDLYQRGGALVRVVETDTAPDPDAPVRREAGAPVVRELARPLLRERLTRVAAFVRHSNAGNDAGDKPAHPPAWCVEAVHLRGDWPGVRRLDALVTHPVLLPGGGILAANGYDARSRLLVSIPPGLTVAVPDRPTPSDVVAATAALMDVVADFPFESPAYRAAWLASLLTPLARFAFTGPAPLFLIDKNVRGAGAGLLADVVALIVTGRRFPVMAYTTDKEELRKKGTSLAVEAERLVLLDNVAGAFGNDVLDAALTSDRWKDRLLGSNRVYDGPLNVTWFATGNNVQIAADTARRVCHVRMESADERPELRTGFRYPVLRDHVRADRGRLLSAALTILRGYFTAETPRHGLPAWGSFEGWADTVRECVVFAGLDDPGATRHVLQTTADRDAVTMTALLVELQRLIPDHRGWTAAQIVAAAKDGVADLFALVEELCGRVDAQTLGREFRTFKRRNFGGRMLDKAGDANHATRWVVVPATAARG